MDTDNNLKQFMHNKPKLPTTITNIPEHKKGDILFYNNCRYIIVDIKKSKNYTTIYKLEMVQ